MKSLALKYRPRTFEDVSGQAYIVKSLKNVITANSIAHAYLFFGTRGIGKTSIARITARCLNCTEGPTSSPCDQCSNCREILNGNNPDVIEMDAASNRGIEYIRDLRDNTKFSPMKSKYKVYIIDEAHMLTRESFNALLKTLEEPPPHVIFILATTEKHKIPETILSRCQNFAFKKFTHEEIESRLRNILMKENILFEDSALRPIAQKSEGSMRDAISCLDQILAYSSSEKIRLEEALLILGVLPFDLYCRILTLIREDNLQEILLILENTHEQGYNLKDFVWSLLNVIKSAYLIKIDNNFEKGNSLSESQFQILLKEVSSWEQEALHQAFYNFYEIYSNPSIFQTSSGNEIKISVEMAIMSLSQKLKQPSIAKLTQKIIQLKEAIKNGTTFEDASPVKSEKKPEVPLSNTSEIDKVQVTETDFDSVIQKEFMGQQDNSKINSKLFDGV